MEHLAALAIAIGSWLALSGGSWRPSAQDVAEARRSLSRKLVVLTATMAISAGATARSTEVCPRLPADSNLVWAYQEGPDFDVCYAHEPTSDETVFGVYLGNHPSFDPDPALRIGKGRVASKRVAWYRQEPGAGEPAWGRQTLLVLDRRSGYVAHVWVGADTEQELQNRLSTLERMVIR